MQFLTDKECIATENFSRGIIYHIEMTSDELYAVCVAVGYNYVQFIDDTGKIFCLSDQTKGSYVTIDVYTPVEPEPPFTNLLQYQTGVPPFTFDTTDTQLFSWYIKGNMSQTGTPTPQNPIQPQECGDLETEGAKAGQYKIPISSANTTTPVYLGEVESTRNIQKLVLTGQENITMLATSSFQLFGVIDWGSDICYCTHFPQSTWADATAGTSDCIGLRSGGSGADRVRISCTAYTSADDFKTYLQQQYANGTPVVVYYVLATPTTGIVNEPIRKIGDYADSINDVASIPTTYGENTLSVETTLQPSEMQIVYKIADI